VLVSPEVGLTVVAATASARRFTDELGTLNQRLATLCDRVVLVVAGQPMPIKQRRA
jgi:adenosylcobinamide kinase/adenosylcobinamide-phosphate guanylyltransferase